MGYFKWTSTTCHLGLSADEKLFTAKMNWAWLSKEPPITLYDRPLESDPILGQASGLKPTKTMDCTVTIPSGTTPMNPDAPMETGAELKYTNWKDAPYVFSILVPPVPGKRKEREIETASDGRKIVAIIINGSAWSMSWGVQFAFLGTGLTGVSGEAWDVTAVVSGLQAMAILTGCCLKRVVGGT